MRWTLFAGLAFAVAVLCPRPLHADEAEDAYAEGEYKRMGGEHEAAVAAYHKALQLEPRLRGAWQGLARTLKKLGRADEAARAQAFADAAPDKREGPAPAPTAEQQAFLDAGRQAAPPAGEVSTFADLSWPRLDPSRWESQVARGESIHTLRGLTAPKHYRFTITPARRFRGDAKAAEEAFKTRIEARMVQMGIADSPGLQLGAVKTIPSPAFELVLMQRNEIGADSGTVVLTAVGLIHRGRFNLVLLEQSLGIPIEADGDVSKALDGIRFTRSEPTAVASPLGRYVLDADYFRSVQEVDARSSLRSGASSRDIEVEVLSRLGQVLDHDLRVELLGDGTYVAGQQGKDASGNPQRVERAGTWKLDGGTLTLVTATENGQPVAKPQTQAFPYRGGAILLDAKAGFRLVLETGALEPE